MEGRPTADFHLRSAATQHQRNQDSRTDGGFGQHLLLLAAFVKRMMLKAQYEIIILTIL